MCFFLSWYLFLWYPFPDIIFPSKICYFGGIAYFLVTFFLFAISQSHLIHYVISLLSYCWLLFLVLTGKITVFTIPGVFLRRPEIKSQEKSHRKEMTGKRSQICLGNKVAGGKVTDLFCHHRTPATTTWSFETFPRHLFLRAAYSVYMKLS